MPISLELIGQVLAALVVSFLIALILTPVVRNLAVKVGAVDVPKDNRRMHKRPIPLMGGLAIFLGFLLGALLFVPLNGQYRALLLGSVIIVVLGIFDDIYDLRAHTREVEFKDNKIIAAGQPDNEVSLQQVIGDVFAASDHLNALGYYAAPPLEYDKSCGVGDAYLSYVYGAAAAEVTVDTRTGFVSVDEFFAVHDVGHAFDKAEAEGQIRGGVSMGVGYAVMEEAI